MYMMKLRYSDDFATRAGSCWSLLFVLCLMPWMRKYRLHALPILEKLDTEIEEAEAELASCSQHRPNGRYNVQQRNEDASCSRP